MNKNFLETIWKKTNSGRVKFAMIMLGVFVGALGLFAFLIKDELPQIFTSTDPDTQKIVLILAALILLMLLSLVVIVGKSLTSAKNGKNVILYDDATSQEEIAKRINSDYNNGRFLLNEPLDIYKQTDDTSGRRLVIADDYILIVYAYHLDDGKVRYIPRDKIYWICAQPGIRGRSSYAARLLVFTEKELIAVDCSDTEHLQLVVAQSYRHIPNVFSHYDPFTLSYELEKTYAKNRAKFLEFYHAEKTARENGR